MRPQGCTTTTAPDLLRLGNSSHSDTLKSVNQLYYDNNTGIYYYYDADTGKYEFHSRIELEQKDTSQMSYSEWKSWKLKKLMSELKNETKTKLRDLRDFRRRQRKTPKKRRRRTRNLENYSPSPGPGPGPGPGVQPRDDEILQSTETEDADTEKKKKSLRAERRRAGTGTGAGTGAGAAGTETGQEEEEEGGEDRSRRRRRDSEGSDLNSEPEEGELSESERDSTWPPCVRVTVVRSPVLQVGTLFILTADSTATIGREKDMDHAIRISELGVSKFHAEVFFDAEQQCYMLVDQGSQNGTVINGNRILQPKQKSPPHPLTHGDEVKMGDTVLSFHIHAGTDTCDGCEPGQIMAHLAKYPHHNTSAAQDTGGAVGGAAGRHDKEALRLQQLKNIKAKYGIQSNEESKVPRNSRYKDRAETRRQTVGSEGVFRRDDAPASVHQEIGEGNKGRKMLEKMGWKKGEGLGKEGSGITDPIELKIRKSGSGLGAAAAVSIDDASLNKTKNQKNWDKARERFNETCVTPAGDGRELQLPPQQ
ncbi:hypothetical protein WMY93_011784 [Mugilogobius chulae]|uniref:Angiogenic factor with G patch and FHA domains 1 n=1 Tax=Mugilogobius chulae TaxID=88201 RepID=A0AAW0P9N4_9GOBI